MARRVLGSAAEEEEVDEEDAWFQQRLETNQASSAASSKGPFKGNKSSAPKGRRSRREISCQFAARETVRREI